ncbi:MAG: tetratricopeptide repeat protein [Deltaproteobacteria bacterium]|nr:tetratricopeptide repeat protein [Deltaproteobacteria bacterium]
MMSGRFKMGFAAAMALSAALLLCPYQANAEAAANGSLLLTEARELKSKGRLRQAIPAYSSAIDALDGPEKDEAAIELASILGVKKRYEEAVRLLLSVLERNPSNIEARKTLARTFGWAGEYDESIKEYEKALALNPEDPEAQTGLGRVLSWKGDLEGAESRLRAALEKSPANNDARLALANALWWNGEPQASLDEANAALSKNPADIEALRLKRRLRHAIGPELNLTFSSSIDSDENKLSVYRALGYVNEDRFLRLSLEYQRIEASRLDEAGEADILTIKDSIDISKWFSVNPRLSFARLESSAGSTGLVAGGVSASWEIQKGLRAAGSAHRYALADTAQLIKNNIRVNEYALAVIHDYNIMTTALEAGLSRYSDDNSRKDLSANIALKLMESPGIVAGAIALYRDFSAKTFSGYFNPRGFRSYSAYLTISDDIYMDRVYYSITGTTGTQAFESKNEDTASLKASIGYRAGENAAFDAGYKWSKSALENPAGFEFNEYRLGFNYLF